MRRYQLGIRDILVLTVVLAITFQYLRSTDFQNPYTMFGWTFTCLAQIPWLQRLWSSVWKKRSRKGSRAFFIAYPVCFVPLIAWALVVLVRVPMTFGLFTDRLQVGPLMKVVFFPVWIYSLTVLFVSFFQPQPRVDEWTFLRLRLLAGFNLIVAVLIISL